MFDKHFHSILLILSLSLLFKLFYVIMGTLFTKCIQTKDVDFEGEPWPVTDDEGYYQSYKEYGRFVNWWHKDIPNGFQIMMGFLCNKDESKIPGLVGLFGNSTRLETELERNIPVEKPYWIVKPEEFGKKEGIRATWIGHATVLAEVDGSVILTDPIFSDRCFPVQWAGPKRYRPPACTIQELPKVIDAVVISHTHYDHLDYNSVLSLHDRYGENLHWYVPSGSKSWFENVGIPSHQIHDMNWWQTKVMPVSRGKPQNEDLGNEENIARIIYTPANHFSRRTLFDDKKALWGSWVVIGSEGSKFWFGGDTAYSDVFKQIGKRYGPFDISAIPIGAYNPRETMKFVHVNPEEALKIHQDLKSKMSFGIHWATFKLTLEDYMEPKNKIVELTKNDQKENLAPFLVPNIGETV